MAQSERVKRHELKRLNDPLTGGGEAGGFGMKTGGIVGCSADLTAVGGGLFIFYCYGVGEFGCQVGRSSSCICRSKPGLQTSEGPRTKPLH